MTTTSKNFRRIGLIELSVWLQEDDHAGEFQVTIRRRFQSHDGEWRATDASSLDPAIAEGVCMTAILWILDAQGKQDLASEPDIDPGVQVS